MPDRTKSLSWDDFRLIGAIAEEGSLAAAAAKLSLNHSTVFRRLAQIEAAVGVSLFERGRAGYTATPAGEDMAGVADEMARGIAGFVSRVEHHEMAPAGDLRVATSDTLLVDLLTPVLVDFRNAFPAIRVEVALGNHSVNLSRRDADVAIRATAKPPDTLVGRRIADIAFALYGARSVERCDVENANWVLPCDDLSGLAFVAALRGQIPAERIGYQVNSILGLAEAIELGAGIGYLPCFIGDARPAMVRLAAPEETFVSSLWLLTHADLRRTPRVRAFLDFVGGRLNALRSFLSGEGIDRNRGAADDRTGAP
ncbi:LysR family transcriptional regulator [Acuticoccus mangrovi]|uniref:LysR family transcriptional regulator n=1 Tax=Acuticoccus mangrovi TaxID=2796142 RepID=A0A934IUG4_9HYPH|nr:LysR family transcriptional regulator [Acuticoccus mangrovi]MBJ3778793.1 LysR family transcriptional regulator [Acuticoccus mangrovi]